MLYHLSRASMEIDRELLKTEGYEIEGPPMTDGWGELYRARYEPLGSEVLFRRFAPSLARHDAAWHLACAEVQAWARIDHPGVLQVLDWGLAGSGASAEAFLVTEMPEGRRLGEILPEGGGRPDEPPFRDIDVVFGLLLEAVEAARRWGVLHLSLSPDCVWVSGGGRVQVSDFGLYYVAREFPGCGSPRPGFLAPEQSPGATSRVSAATDVYSLGLVLAALHGGAEGVAAVAAGAFPGQLEARRRVLAPCMDPEPAARYASAGELAAALGFDISEGPDSTEERFRDCPLCRLKEEIMRERPTTATTRGSLRGPGGREVPVAWALVMALVLACLVVWYLALR